MEDIQFVLPHLLTIECPSVFHIKNIHGSKRAKKMDMNYNWEKMFYTTVDGVPVRKLFVGNIPPETTNSSLLEYFGNYGDVMFSSIVHKPTYEKSFAFVTFATPQEAAVILRMKGKLFFKGKRLYLSPADSWHQPQELPNGEIIWDTRNITRAVEIEADDEEEDDEFEEGTHMDSHETEPAISTLNDDCLCLIFRYFNIYERLKLTQVCRRWRNLNACYWNNIKELDFTVEPLSQQRLTNGLLELYLSLCQNVTSLNIAQDNNNLTPTVIVIIAKYCKNLREFTMRNVIVQRRSLALLAQSCPNLVAFNMDACPSPHDGEMIALVKKSKQLERLGLKYSSSRSGAWLKYLKCPLKSLSLEMYEFNPDTLIQGIDSVKETLRELSFVSCSNLRKSDLDTITSLVPHLASLTVSGMFTQFKTNSLNSITNLSNLMYLDLEHNRVVCDSFMTDLVAGCPKLKHLNISGIENMELTEKGLSLMVKFTDLTHLRMACLLLNDNILRALAKKLKKLTHLDLSGCQHISDEGCIAVLTYCPNLESLDVAGCSLVTNETIHVAIKLTGEVPRKKLSIVAGNTQVVSNELFFEADVKKRLNLDLKSTIIANVWDDLIQEYFDEDDEDDYDQYYLSDDTFESFDRDDLDQFLEFDYEPWRNLNGLREYPWWGEY